MHVSPYKSSQKVHTLHPKGHPLSKSDPPLISLAMGLFSAYICSVPVAIYCWCTQSCQCLRMRHESAEPVAHHIRHVVRLTLIPEHIFLSTEIPYRMVQMGPSTCEKL